MTLPNSITFISDWVQQIKDYFTNQWILQASNNQSQNHIKYCLVDSISYVHWKILKSKTTSAVIVAVFFSRYGVFLINLYRPICLIIDKKKIHQYMYNPLCVGLPAWSLCIASWTWFLVTQQFYIFNFN